MSELHLYNTLTKKIEKFEPIKGNEVRMYACGLTVYNYAHIGNLRTYIFNDILKSVLLYNGFKIRHVMNITDVGHLTGDDDTGEDKLEVGAEREGKAILEIAQFYTEEFNKDLKRLNISSPDIWCRATEHINEMIEMIRKIERNGFTYTTGGNVYFDTSKFKDYEELSGIKRESLKNGARVQIDRNKKNPRDFVLWFTISEKFKNHILQWDSPWGRGWPGWHIECSAMSSKYLGDQFDIHTGGIDHIPIHHTNEIAQSEAALSVHPWVKYWLHGEFLVLEQEKMSKSKGNFITLNTLIEEGFAPLDYRYFCLNAHYRKPLMFSFAALDNARNSYMKLKSRILVLKEDSEDSEDSKDAEIKSKYEQEFLNALNNDMNIPNTLAIMYNALNDQDMGNKEKFELIKKFDTIFKLDLEKVKKEEIQVPEAVMELVEKREQARKSRDFETADRLRKKIEKMGYKLEDAPEGTIIKKQ